MRTDRIRELMEHKGLSQADLAREAGISQPAIQQILNGTTMRTRRLPEIARALDVTVSFLMGYTDNKDEHAFETKPSPEEMALELGVTRVRQVPVEYGMGGGTYIEDYVEEKYSFFDSEWIQQITDSPAASLFVARGIGDSMFPTLHDSDSLLVDRAQTRIMQQDRIWALTYGDVGMIKRVRKQPRGTFLIMSDSPHVSDFEADAADVHVIGRVIWIGRRA